MQPLADPLDDHLWRSFVDGLTRHSTPSLLIAGALCGAILLWCTKTIDEAFVLKNRSLFAEYPGDESFTAANVLFEATQDVSQQPVVVLLGDVNVESARLLQSQINKQTRVRCLGLSYPRQTLWESVALLGRLPKSDRGVVVLQLSPSCLQVGRETLSKLVKQPRLPFRSRPFDLEVETAGLSHPGLSGNYFLDNQGFLVRRTMGVAVRRLVPSSSFDGHTGVSIDSDPVAPEGRVEENLKVLDRIVERVLHRSRLDLVIDAYDLDEPSRQMIQKRVSHPMPSGRVTWLTDPPNTILRVIEEQLGRLALSEDGR